MTWLQVSRAEASSATAASTLDHLTGQAGNAPGAAAVHAQLLQQQQVCELFVRLLCQYEPRAVLPFLEGHGAYR